MIQRFRSLFVVLARNWPRLLALLAGWPGIAWLAWLIPTLDGNVMPEVGALFVLIVWAAYLTASFVQDVICQTKPE